MSQKKKMKRNHRKEVRKEREKLKNQKGSLGSGLNSRDNGRTQSTGDILL